ncbi:MAG: peptide chain release factor N(5)-glutamine methyltransferase [Pyrinomonadaceae bacterium]
MADVSENLKFAAEILRANGISAPRREAVSLLVFALGKDQTFLVAHDDYKLSEAEEIRFQNFLWRRARREPLQYIRGAQEFYGLDFVVTPDVLIPRPETELIVENAVEILKNVENPRFCEVGAGSGCISISILHEIKTALATGLDISENALQVARKNAENNNVSERLELRFSDIFQTLRRDETFDLIVSNPPYISPEDLETLQAEVRLFEPRAALTDGGDGFSIIEKIILDAPNFLRGGGYLLMEIGFQQARKVSEMFDKNIWQSLELLPDLQGIARTVKARAVNRQS